MKQLKSIKLKITEKEAIVLDLALQDSIASLETAMTYMSTPQREEDVEILRKIRKDLEDIL